MPYSEDEKKLATPGPVVGQIVIREMQPKDAAQVALLIKQLGYDRPEEEVLLWIQGLPAEGDRQIAYVACIKEEVVGWIQVLIVHHLQQPPYALIGGLVVKDGFRGSGIGRSLCERAEAWSWQKQIGVVRVTSRSTRDAAHRFYLRDGYRLAKTSLVFEKIRRE
jgi:GNAT superfamily N-acetyltransferase